MYSGDDPFDQEMAEIHSEAILDMETVRSTDIDKFSEFLYELSQSTIRSLASEFVKGMNQVSNAVGNTINAGNQPFSYDHVLDLMEKMEIDFDDKGQPIGLALIVHPTLAQKIANLDMTAEQEKRRELILARKKART